jgi:hypothetical protein
MTPAERQIVNDFITYILKHNRTYSDWYFGFTSDVEHHLFNEHNVDKDKDLWIYHDMGSLESARNIVEYFVNTKRTKGTVGAGNEKATNVYCYLISRYTVENI